jgi:hypothetical protein
MEATGRHAAGTVQVRVSYWTWGFKSPLAHVAAARVWQAGRCGIDGTPLAGVGGVLCVRDTPGS